MFSRLRNRFLFLLMGTVTVLMLLFFSAIVLVSYHDANRRNNEMVDRGFNSHEAPADINDPDKFSPTFSIDLDETGNITAIHSSYDMDSTFYDTLIANAQRNNADVGSISYGTMTFKYKLFPLSNGQRIVFLDISRDMQAITNMMFSFFWIAFPLLILIFLISKFFADRAINPIQESFDRQNQFIADASHEIKTPLATIHTNASVLLEGATAEQKKWIDFIKDEVIRLEKLTNSLLYLSREPKAEFTKCNFSYIAGGVLMPLEAVFYEKQIECSCTIEKDVFVMGSEEQFRRLVNILMDNAVKYADGQISIRLCKESRSAVFTVANNGIGISADDLPKIWHRFYRTDKARRHEGGFGLGLAMAKSIVTELGGKIKVSSTPDKMTEFVVTLPLQ